MQIYVVVSGEYSDFGIEAMFTDRGKARQYCCLYNAEAENGEELTHSEKGYAYTPDYRIQTWELDPEVPPVPEGKRGFHVYMSRCGEAAVVRSSSIISAQRFQHSISFHDGRKLFTYSDNFSSTDKPDGERLNGKPNMSTHVIARDEQHAIKIVNEKRAQLIALGRWPAEYDSHGSATIKEEDEDA